MARLMSAKVEFDSGDLQKKLLEFDKEFDRKLGAIVDMNAATGEAWMKKNAPWTDRTGAARSGLTAIPSHHGKQHEILLAYSVSYGIWLEVANSGKYQILAPAARAITQKILADTRMIFGGAPGPTPPGIPSRARAKLKPNMNKSGTRRGRKRHGKGRGNR